MFPLLVPLKLQRNSMKPETVAIIIREIREEFQFPPYFKDASINNYILEGEAELLKLVEDIDFDEDRIARSLLKNYVNYAYYKRTDEFFENYNGNIIGWQMNQL